MPRIVDHAERRAAIARSAALAIAELGLEQATMREIAARSGVSKGIVAHYFAREQAALDARQSETFRRCALELVERQVSHIQKESMALLPMLEELLDEDVDRELSFAYSAG